MTREEAITIIGNLEDKDILFNPCDVQDAKTMAIKALEQEPSGDLISRTEVRKFVEYIQSIKDNHNENQTPINYGTICDIVIEGWNLLKLSPVNPQEPKTGHWIDGDRTKWKCSNCGYGVLDWNNTPYCPNCGARMVEPQESEDKE